MIHYGLDPSTRITQGLSWLTETISGEAAAGRAGPVGGDRQDAPVLVRVGVGLLVASVAGLLGAAGGA